ncbi:aminopeptidase P family protein [Alphaproteobacteria bacterium LSUCC0684]
MSRTLKTLRERLKKERLDAFLIPRGDCFSGEEVPASDERLAHVSGFTGSAGTAVVTPDQAALFSDGRYTLQMQVQTSDDWQTFTVPERSTTDWIREHVKGGRLGFDPWLMTVDQHRMYETALKPEGIRLRPVSANPIDLDWADRPPPPASKAWGFSPAVAGAGRGEKIERTINAMKKANPAAAAMIISDPASLAWLLNIRGGDLAHTPVILAFALLSASGEVTIFADAGRFDEIDQDHLAFAAPGQLSAILSGQKGSVMVDPSTCPVAIWQMLGAAPIEAVLPIVAMKAEKTSAEADGFRAAHQRDAVAMIRFLAWFDDTLRQAQPRETEVAEKLIEFRQQEDGFLSPSFASICGGGANGAIVHYRAVAGQDQPVPRDNLCLIDSGGQYRDATTDITRTVATGTPSDEMAEAYTHVLRAHIALDRTRFPHGTTGMQLDAITRAPLWQQGMDYDHGTGHGVGCCLGVHEGPASISRRGAAQIRPGMVLSNEPGYYVTGGFGIRTENLVLVVEGDDGNLEFEALTLVPFDRRLIRPELMSEAETEWVDAYHERVRREISPLVARRGDARAEAWLAEFTAPLGRGN